MTACFILFYSCNPPTQNEVAKTRVDYWIEDLDYLAENLPLLHANLYRTIDEDYFTATIELIKSNLEYKTDGTIFIELHELFNKIRDVNTYLEPLYTFTELPVRMKYFPDGIFITEVTPTTINLYSKKVSAIGSKSWEYLKEDFNTITSSENTFGSAYQLEVFLNKTLFLKYFGYTEHIYQAEFSFDNYPTINIIEEPNPFFQSIYTFDNFILPAYLKSPDSDYYTEYIASKNISYLHLINVNELEENDFNETINTWLETDTEKYVFDLRFCRSDKISSAINLLYNTIEEKQVQLFVCIDNSTTNFGIDIALYCRDHFQSLLVGSSVGGRISHSSYKEYFELPNNLTKIYYPTKVSNELEPSTDTLTPDETIELLSHHYFEGIDPIIEYISEK